MSLISKLRRIALEHQGLLHSNQFGRGKKATQRAIEQLGYVQIDTISVVERAHHHVLWSRVDNYSATHLEQLTREREIFEYWFHAASWLPMRDYRFAIPRMSQMNGERNWFANCEPKLLRQILHRIEVDGPLRARDFADAKHRNRGWWEWKPAKQALEQLFMQGQLMVSAREGFQKVYDLPQRVIPAWVDTSAPSLEDYAKYLVATTLRAHGFATQTAITYLRKGQALRQAVRQELQNQIDNSTLTKLTLGANCEVYIDPERLESRAPHSRSQLRILSPFDNAVIQRQRVHELFAFDFQIECYLPATRRQFGYFSLPMLYRDEFVGRIDCKAHRAGRQLEVKSLHFEQRDHTDLVEPLCTALKSFAAFNNCDEIRISDAAAESSLQPIPDLL